MLYEILKNKRTIFLKSIFLKLVLNNREMITKQKLLQHINKFPDNLSIDELIDKLIFIDKLEKRIEESKNGETISEADLEKEMKEWFK